MSTLPSPSSRWSVEPSQLERVAAALPKEFLRRNAALAPYTTFKIGGPADLLLEATSADVLADAVLTARTARVPWFVLGLGANVLVGDLGVRGLVVRNTASRFEFSPEGRLDVETGAVMAKLIPEAVRRGWSGLEHYVGIPSTVGGAIWQNLHFLSPAPERERTMFIAEVFESAELLTQENERMVADAAYMRFGYDDSVLHHRSDIALKATFQLARKSPDEMHRIMQENLSWRGSRHPWLEYHPSVGSIFKKIEGIGAGRLVDQCGLKGYRMGDAQISHIHANIMVNLGNATSSDVIALIRHAQRSVKERFGYDLEPEIDFVGEF
ncbi:MAG TPA: UDP-N-acetylmuramate dehydrogenase [Gemmatimonadaceae bacterium]